MGDKGKGWFGESRRHREAALRRHKSKRGKKEYESHNELLALVGPDSDIYPTEDLIRNEVEFNPKAIKVLEEFKWKRPWSGSYVERKEKFRWLISKLAQVYGISPPTSIFSGNEVESKATYLWEDNSILLDKLSVVTVLHEFAHAKGYSERWAVFWSVNLFKRVFPRNFSRANAERSATHMLTPSPVSEEVGRRVVEGKITDIVCGSNSRRVTIAAPHEVHSGSGHLGDLHTGVIARKLAEVVGGRLVVFTDFVRRDVNVNHFVYLCNREILSSRRGVEVYKRYASHISSPVLVEIHGHASSGNKILVASNGISLREARKIKALSDDIVKFYVDRLEQIPLSAVLAKRFGEVGRHKSLHIEIPKSMREDNDLLIPYLKRVVEVVL